MGNATPVLARIIVTLGMLASTVAYQGVLPAVADPVPPYMEARATPDVAHGATRFEIDLFGMFLPREDNFIRIEAVRDGVPVVLDPEGGAIEIQCPADSDPANDPAITNRCAFSTTTVTEPGDYLITVYVNFAPVSGEYSATATLEGVAVQWWTDVTVLERSADIFIGNTTFRVRFNAVPTAVPSLELAALIDQDFDGNLDTVVQTIECVMTGPAEFTCDTDDRPLPPRCTDDHLSGVFCLVDPNYSFRVNGIDVPALGFEAIHYQLSRYDEGRFFGRADVLRGAALGETIELDRFVLDDPQICAERNASFCFDAGYYQAWLGHYVAELDALVAREGRFDIDVIGSTAQVMVAIPRLPVGTHGLSASLAYHRIGADGAPGPTSTHELTCTAEACVVADLDDLAPGTYVFELHVQNDHPVVDFEDGTSWGGERFATIPFTTEVVVAGDTPVVPDPVTPTPGAPTTTIDVAVSPSSGSTLLLALTADQLARGLRIVSVLQPAQGRAVVGEDATSISFDPDPARCTTAAPVQVVATLSDGSTTTVRITVDCDDAQLVTPDGQILDDLLATSAFINVLTDVVIPLGLAPPGTQDLRSLDPAALSVVLSRLGDLLRGRSTSFTQADSPAVVVASAVVFADALASGTLQTGGTRLLLTDPDRLDRAVHDEIVRLGVDTVTILGGEGAIGPAVASDLTRAGLTISRIAGSTRIETAAAIAAQAPTTGRALLTRAHPVGALSDPTQAFADSLAAGGWAAGGGFGLLLTQPEVLTGTTRDAIQSTGYTDVTVIGGPSAIADDILTSATLMDRRTDRVAGPDRFATAVAIARARTLTPERVIVIEGQADDAWIAGVTAARLSGLFTAPIILSNGDVLPPSTVSYLHGVSATDGRPSLCMASPTACDIAADHLGADVR